MSTEDSLDLLPEVPEETSTEDVVATPTQTDDQTKTVDEIEEESQTNPHEWAKSLDDTLKKSMSLHKFKDVGSLAKAYVEIEKNMGKSPFPGPKSTEEERIAFYRKAGVPEPDKYDFDNKKYGLPDDISKEMKEIASKNGIAPSALSGILDFIKEKNEANTSALIDQSKAVIQKQLDSIKKEYGSAFDKYRKLGAEVAKQVFNEEEIAYIKQNKLLGNPIFAKLLMDRAKGMYGEEMIEDDHTKKNIIATPEAIEKRIQEILGDKDYHNQTSARHGSLVQEMEKLFVAKEKIS